MTTTGDSLAYGTLRSAVNWANFSFNDNQENTNSAPNTIRFDTSNVFSSPQTITLTLGTLDFTNNAGTAEAISGDGSANLTISGENASEVLSIASGVTVYLSDLTIATARRSWAAAS